MRLLADGTRAPGWQANGNILSDLPGYQTQARLVADGAGGAWVAYLSAPSSGWIQHVTGSGVPAPGWSSTGLPLVSLPSTGQTEIRFR
jgi:hypothetical protein